MVDTRCHSSFKTVYTSHAEKSCTEKYKKACKLEMVEEEVAQEREGCKMILQYTHLHLVKGLAFV